MKKLFLLLSILLSVQLANCQEKVYEYRYHTKDGSISMSISSDNMYVLDSWRSLGSDDDDPGISFTWSEGFIQSNNDTLVCVDSTNYKKLFILRESEYMVNIVGWNDYKNREDETNCIIGWEGFYDKVFLDDFLTRNNCLYLQTIYEGTSENRRLKLLKAYSWKDGKKKKVYEDGIGFIRE